MAITGWRGEAAASWLTPRRGRVPSAFPANKQAKKWRCLWKAGWVAQSNHLWYLPRGS
jgi:hypothetical protein